MKLDKLIQLRKTISAHAHEAISAPLAYKMMKFLKASGNEDDFYTSRLKEIVEKYRDTENPAQQGDAVRIRKDKITECSDEIKALTETEVEAPSIKFALPELSELKLSVAEMYSLDEVIIEEG